MVFTKKALRGFDKRASQIRGIPEREEKFKLQLQKWKDEQKHFEKGLKQIKNRKWDKGTKTTKILLEDGSTKALRLSKSEFEKLQESDIKTLTDKLAHVEQHVKEHGEIHKRVFPKYEKRSKRRRKR